METPMIRKSFFVLRWLLAAAAITVVFGGAAPASAQVAVASIAATDRHPAITLFYPTDAPVAPVSQGPFRLQLATQAAPRRGNGRLVVISHGSGASPWVMTNLASSLVRAGFVVALPAHKGDNYLDNGNPGPDSWAIRPAEVSRTIDAVGQHTTLAPLLALDRVGVYGMSAGGHTALSFAGGRWSAAGFKQHCDANIGNDFAACVGLITRLTGGIFDGLKKWGAVKAIGWRFADAKPLSHHDPRVAAAVAGVPFAADFDMASLVTPSVPLGLVTAQQDRWLLPRFHSDRVLQACSPRCELLADLPTAGHGALLSPLPPGFTGLEADLLNDPPGFERAVMAEVDQKITAFFVRQLLPLTGPSVVSGASAARAPAPPAQPAGPGP
jgi:predicted dienelactone hydrolase